MRVILARPHDFIVSDMKAMLERLGYEVVRCDSRTALDEALSAPAAGVVISTAIQSSVGLTVAQTFAVVRAALPEVPVAFASLSTSTVTRDLVSGELPALSRTGRLVLAEHCQSESLGTPNVYLCLQREAVKNGTVDDAVRRHFPTR